MADVKITPTVMRTLEDIAKGGVRTLQVGKYGSTRIFGTNHPPTVSRLISGGLARKNGDSFELTEAGSRALKDAESHGE